MTLKTSTTKTSTQPEADLEIAIENQAQIVDWLGKLGIRSEVIAHRTLPFFPQVDEKSLVTAQTNADGKAFLLTLEAASAWWKMCESAKVDGIELYLVSAFRSVEYQMNLIKIKQQLGIAPEEFFTYLAPPGCSEHHTGCAIDINTPDCDEVSGVFGDTPAFEWLRDNAFRFGFKMSFPLNNPWGFIYEPWHWCWHPAAD
ncbi:M15 family metallopeptidase [Serratia sp. M24T3]|uniref:M15 family metallopeptidase n=1 Tax=Serratia sp. M24T3 TaxID=932213 RepID=UPI00025B8F1E|nr:M15 family metallopeptidase [Serratia sp. M24T3]EIC84304.1 peptidase M15B and M15C DD-carboxypeptidase VanY/endolysin [Serratia sp. M24T3]